MDCAAGAAESLDASDDVRVSLRNSALTVTFRTPRPGRASDGKESDMLKWALIFAIVALIAGGLGFTGLAGAAAGIAKILFFLFLVGFVVFLVLGFWAGRKITGN
jgi:uncharacterized membrane protein YtjA (UPF0391 family)